MSQSSYQKEINSALLNYKQIQSEIESFQNSNENGNSSNEMPKELIKFFNIFKNQEMGGLLHN